MFSPLKFVIEPASFTLGSHIAIFIAMFISLPVAIAVSLGTALGFLLGGFPPVIVLRALSHVVFAYVGAAIIAKTPDILRSVKKIAGFALLVGMLHGVCEVIVVSLFYFGMDILRPEHALRPEFYESGFFMSVFILVGVGTIIHSCVDFILALGIWKVIPNKKFSKS
jgi:niacin transporter